VSAGAGGRAVRVGVAGAGALGFHHIRILRDFPGVSFAGFYERSPARAAQVAQELGVRAFDTLEALLDEVDALTVVVATQAHHAIARPALERGKHVLIEKPITATIEQADDLLDVARRVGVVVQTGHVERFNRAVRAALPHIHAPRFIESERLAPFTPRGSDVAVVLDLMIHDIDLVLALAGSHIAEVRAVGVPVLTPTVDIANARLAFASGAVANITASRVSRERTRKLRIFQPSGYLSLDLARGDGQFLRLRERLDLAELASAPRELEAFVERVPLQAPEGEPLRLEFDGFIAAIEGRAPVVVSGEDGREALDAALRIVREIERTLPALSGAAGGGDAARDGA
jgi:predicted dehydrogenase